MATVTVRCKCGKELLTRIDDNPTNFKQTLTYQEMEDMVCSECLIKNMKKEEYSTFLSQGENNETF